MPMSGEGTPSPRLVGTLKALRVLYVLLLVPAVWFGLFALFVFVFAIERRLLDWMLFFYAVAIFALMLAAVVLTGRFIRLGKLRSAFALYIAPVLLVAVLVLYDLIE